MKKFLKNIIYFLLSLFRHEGGVILMYHSIGDNREFFTVSEKEFDRQMAYLKENNFNVVTLMALVGMLENKLLIPNKTIAITFDDGYEDNFQNAFPILSKYGFPATIFVSTANIGGKLIARRGTRLNIVSIGEIIEMGKSGLISFGSHSHDHIKLTSLDKVEINKQLSVSKKILENILNNEQTFFAYPSGRADDGVKNIAKEYFRIGFGVQKGRVMLGDDMMELKRNSVDREVSFMQFKGIVTFGRI